ncbi:MAG: YlxR family protein [Anaerolineae bacterium]|nr:YlxR family protein [Anaerolineae bacterium]
MKNAKRAQKRRHVPERTCVACRTQRPKRSLVRVVHTVSGEIVVDETGKLNGRGAYLCRCRPCWEQALKRGALSRALRASVSPETEAMLRAYAETLPEALPVPEETAAT